MTRFLSLDVTICYVVQLNSFFGGRVGLKKPLRLFRTFRNTKHIKIKWGDIVISNGQLKKTLTVSKLKELTRAIKKQIRNKNATSEMISTHYARSVIFMYTPCAKLVLYMCLDPVTSALRQLSPPGAESKNTLVKIKIPTFTCS